MALDIAQLLAFAVNNHASDLHLSAGVPPMIRVDGDMKRVNLPALSHKEVQSMVYDIMNDKQRKAYEEFFETDFSFELPKLARFRVNAFNQNRGAGAVFRTIPSVVRTLDDLATPKIFKDLCLLPRGLVLVTGPTGSGKSTTLAAMVDHCKSATARACRRHCRWRVRANWCSRRCTPTTAPRRSTVSCTSIRTSSMIRRCSTCRSTCGRSSRSGWYRVSPDGVSRRRK